MLKLYSNLTVQGVKDYNGKQYGKICKASPELVKFIGERKEVYIFVLDSGEVLVDVKVTNILEKENIQEKE